MPSWTGSFASRLRRCSSRKGLVVGELYRPVERRLQVERVVHEAGGVLRRLVERLVEVPAPDLGRVHVELAGQGVHGPLDGVAGLGTPGAAVGVGGRQVGEDALDLDGERVERVDAGEHRGPADRDDRGQELQVGAHVVEKLHPHPEDLAVGVRGHLDVLDLAAAVDGRLVVLGAVLDVLDGYAQPLGQHDGQDLLAVDVQLGAEPAAHVGGNHPDLVLRYPGRQGEHDLGEVGHLGGREHHEPPVPRVG
jgi:hypothetical protein